MRLFSVLALLILPASLAFAAPDAPITRGELDGLITARAPSCFVRGAPNIGRLFPDFRTAEEALTSAAKSLIDLKVV